MKILSMQGLQRIPFLKWGKRIVNGGSAVMLVNVQRRAPVACCHGSYVLRHLVWKLKSQWKQALRWQRSSAQFSYDLHSYSQNFDDGFFHDHISPFAPPSNYLPPSLDKP